MRVRMAQVVVFAMAEGGSWYAETGTGDEVTRLSRVASPLRDAHRDRYGLRLAHRGVDDRRAPVSLTPILPSKRSGLGCAGL